MERPESFYDREGGVAWGPITAQEILDDIERRRKKKVARRQTVNSLPTFDNKKLRTIYEKKNDKESKENFPLKYDNLDESNASVVVISSDEDEDDLFEKQDRSLSDVTEEHSKDMSSYLGIKMEKSYTELKDKSTIDFEDDLILEEEQESGQIASNSAIGRLSTPESLGTRSSQAKYISIEDKNINIPDIRIISPTPVKKSIEPDETLEDNFEDQIDFCTDPFNKSYSNDSSESDDDIIDLDDSDDKILATSPNISVPGDLNRSTVYSSTKDRQPTPANLDESTYDEFFESCDDQKIEGNFVSDEINQDISMNKEGLNINEHQISKIHDISTGNIDDEYQENQDDVLNDSGDEIEILNITEEINDSSLNISIENAAASCQEDKLNVFLNHTSEVIENLNINKDRNDSSSIIPNISTENADIDASITDTSEVMEKLNISEGLSISSSNIKNISSVNIAADSQDDKNVLLIDTSDIIENLNVKDDLNDSFSSKGDVSLNETSDIRGNLHITGDLKDSATNIENISMENITGNCQKNKNVLLIDTSEIIDNLNISKDLNDSFSNKGDVSLNESSDIRGNLHTTGDLKDSATNIENISMENITGNCQKNKNVLLSDTSEIIDNLNISKDLNDSSYISNTSNKNVDADWREDINLTLNKTSSIMGNRNDSDTNIQNISMGNVAESHKDNSDIIENLHLDKDLNDSFSNISSNRNIDIDCQDDKNNISLNESSRMRNLNVTGDLNESVTNTQNISMGNFVGNCQENNILLIDTSDIIENLNVSDSSLNIQNNSSRTVGDNCERDESDILLIDNSDLMGNLNIKENLDNNDKNDSVEEMEILNVSESKPTTLKHLNISEKICNKFEENPNISFNDSLNITQGEDIKPKNLESSLNIRNNSSRTVGDNCERDESDILLIDNSDLMGNLNIKENLDNNDKNDSVEEMEILNVSESKPTTPKHLNISEEICNEFEGNPNISFNDSLNITQGEDIKPKDLQNEYCDRDICIATNEENKTDCILDDSLEEIEKIQTYPKHLDESYKEQRFNDTLEEMERLLNEGLNYSMQTDVDTKSDIDKLQIPEDKSKIRMKNEVFKTPQKNLINQIKANSASKSNQNKGAISKKVPKSEIKKPCIPVPSRAYKPKSTLTPTNKFLTPNTKQLSAASTPSSVVTTRFRDIERSAASTPSSAVTKSRFKNIESPISFYIKNSGKTPLFKKVNPTKSLSCEKIKTIPIKKTDKENSILFPEVIYKPAKSTIVVKETNVKLPKKIESLIPQRMNVVKHTGRVGGAANTSISRKLLEGDLTIDSNSSLNTTKDISIVHRKNAFIP